MNESDVRRLIDEFNAAWNDHDLDATVALVSADFVFDSTGPAPDGERFVGPDEARRAWAPIFSDARTRFDVEESFVAGDRVTQRWRYEWPGGHVRGVDDFRVAGGRVTEKLSYVKG